MTERHRALISIRFKADFNLKAKYASKFKRNVDKKGDEAFNFN